MRLIRVFPRRTKATPNDEMAFVGEPPILLPALLVVWLIKEIVT